MNIFRKLLKDKSAAALVYVIVAAAVIILLGAATTAVAYANLQATRVQAKSENNFYSADSVMNAVVGGLENDISHAYDKAYTEIITKYGGGLTGSETPPDVEAEFQMIFQEDLKELLGEDSESGSTGFYSVVHLQDYVQGTFPDNVSYTISAVGGNNFMDLTDNFGLILRNLHVTYEDDNGYYDEITTDVKIVPPAFTMDFTPPQNEWNDILLVADDGFEAVGGTGINMNGNIYLGEVEEDKSYSDVETGNTILVREHAAVAVVSPIETIAGGDVVVKDFSSLSMMSKTENNNIPTANFWMENVEILRQSAFKSAGNMYVYDDLEVNGAYSTVEMSGKYVGFTKSNDTHKDSSSMNINGTHTTLDFSNLQTLIIAGSSYVRTSSESMTRDDSTVINTEGDIELGEAFSVKSNQIAYLVNEKAFVGGKLTTTQMQGENPVEVTVLRSNPMNYNQYSQLISIPNWKELILNAELEFKEGMTYGEYGADIMPLFSNKNGGTVYLYLVFSDSEKAADYFNDVSASETQTGQQLRTYAEQYLYKFTVSETTNLKMNSNFIRATAEVWDEEYPTGIVGDDGEIIYDENNIQRIVPVDGNNHTNGLGYSHPDDLPADEAAANAYNRYLVGSENIPAEKYKVTFELKINEEKLKEVINQATTAAQTDANTNNQITVINNGVIFNATSGSKAILIDNAGKDDYVVTGGKGIIIATGNVKIEGNWLGTIISKQRVFLTKQGTEAAPVDFTYDEGTVTEALSVYFNKTSDGAVTTFVGPINVFKGYENFNPNRATQFEGTNMNLIKNCITFTNWNKD